MEAYRINSKSFQKSDTDGVLRMATTALRYRAIHSTACEPVIDDSLPISPLRSWTIRSRPYCLPAFHVAVKGIKAAHHSSRPWFGNQEEQTNGIIMRQGIVIRNQHSRPQVLETFVALKSRC